MKRAREHGIVTGSLPTGKLNKISDVPGVTVGHCTIADDTHNTGVTVVMPCADNMFIRKLPCAAFVLNGFGKTAGLVQIDELGTLETPIALTNTLNIGRVHDAVVGYMLDRCEKDHVRLTSVNPVVCECNDASLNDIASRAVGEKHVLQAIASARADFEEGAVGCGRGTTCHGLKGGVGSASRVLNFDGNDYTLGVLAQTNHGRLRDLVIAGDPVGERVHGALTEGMPDKGSCIIILATDLPLSDRQLRRVVKRCSVGLARLGSFIGHGSGEVFIAFSTVNRTPAPEETRAVTPLLAFNENKLDQCFRAAAECTEEAVLNSMLCAESVTAVSGTVRHTLDEFI